MEKIHLIQMSIEDLDKIIEEACERGALKALASIAKSSMPEQQVTLEDAMQLTGYATKDSFRQYCKDNGIKPVAVRARRNYYLPSHLLNVTHPKGMRRK